MVRVEGAVAEAAATGRRTPVRVRSGTSGGITPSAGSTTSHARLFFAPKFSNQCTGLLPGSTPRFGARATALIVALFPDLFDSSESLMSSSFFPTNALGRSSGMPLLVVVRVDAGQIGIAPRPSVGVL